MSEQITSLDQEELDYLTSSEYKFDYPGLIDAMNTPQFTILTTPNTNCSFHRTAL